MNIQLNTLYEHKIEGDSITSVGADHIQFFLKEHEETKNYLFALDSLLLTTKDGNIPKRIGRYFYKEYGVKISPQLRTEIGNIVSQHRVPTDTYYFLFTRDFNWNRGSFGDDGSCFWTTNKGAKHIILHHGGMAVQFFRSPDAKDTNGLARAWVAPDTPQEGLLTIFNGYARSSFNVPSNDATAEIVKIIADWLGVAYRPVRLKNQGDEHGLLYINGTHSGSNIGRGFLVGTDDRIDSVIAGAQRIGGTGWKSVLLDLDWEDPFIGNCFECRRLIHRDEEGYVTYNNSYVCQDCIDNYFVYCHGSGALIYRTDAVEVDGEYYSSDYARLNFNWSRYHDSYLLPEESVFLTGHADYVSIQVDFETCVITNSSFRTDPEYLVYIDRVGYISTEYLNFYEVADDIYEDFVITDNGWDLLVREGIVDPMNSVDTYSIMTVPSFAISRILQHREGDAALDLIEAIYGEYSMDVLVDYVRMYING